MAAIGLPFIITFFILLFFWGFFMYVKWSNYHDYNKNRNKVPNWVKNTCPDYWTTVGNDLCQNTFNVGICNGEHNFADLSESEKCTFSKT